MKFVARAHDHTIADGLQVAICIPEKSNRYSLENLFNATKVRGVCSRALEVPDY